MLPGEIKSLNDQGAIFIVNHSGGKDSQAMYLFLKEFIPIERLVVIHADLPEVDWDGIEDHIMHTIKIGTYFEVVRAKKTFFEMVEHRKMWPSADCRQCTSDLKRGPIEKAIRHYLKKVEKNIIVNCMGIRAEESASRAKAQTFKFDKRNSRAGRIWYNWLPIHAWTEQQVFYEIKNKHTQKPHWAYGKGMSRLSCCFCIMASKADLKTAATLKPDLYRKYCEMEKKIDHTFIMPSKKNGKKFLPEVIKINKTEDERNY